MRRVMGMMAATGAVVLLSACATRGYVDDKVSEVNQRVDNIDSSTQKVISRLDAQVSIIDLNLNSHKERLAQHDADLAKLQSDLAVAQKLAQEALDRAASSGKLTEGKMLYEVVLSDEHFNFGFDDDNLSNDTKSALDSLAAELKSENQGVYIEIQGHTDSRGEAAYNQKLGERRAMAVYRYLHTKGGLPLHRMNVISYGEVQPVASNMTEDGRKKNRRVVLVVLK